MARTAEAPAPPNSPAFLRPNAIGARRPRVEDDRLLAGRGRFVADVQLPGAVEIAVVRSQMAHARFRVDVSAALRAPGVVTAVAADDLTGAAPIPDFFPHARPVEEFPLQRERARYVGAPLAAVVAEDRYLAEDAAELVEIQYEELPAAATPAQALADGAAPLFDTWPDNRLVHSPATRDPDVERAFGDAWRVVGGTFAIGRQAPIPMESRGCVALFEDGRLTLWTSTQIPHILRSLIPMVLGVRERDVRVISPDVGGGFGAKAEVYPEEFLVCWLAMHRADGRPVRFVEDRVEHMVSTGQARDTVVEMEAAIDRRGRILALRGRVTQDAGSGEIYPCGFNPAFVVRGALTQGYAIPLQQVGVTCVATNKTPSGAYRGFGNPEAQFAIERLIDRCAAAAGVDPIDLRRGMLLQPDDLPHETPTGAVIDSGSHLEAFDRALDLGRRSAERWRVRLAADPRRRVGLGVSAFVEGTTPSYFGDSGNWAGHESASVRFDPDGSLTVSAGVMSAGQGTQTMLATVAGDLLRVPPEAVRVSLGDTDAAPYGLGSWGSRSTAMASGALVKAADEVRTKALRIAAHLLEAHPDDVTVDDHGFHAAGVPDRNVGWRDVATAALVRTLELPPGEEPGLEARATHDLEGVDHRPRADGRMNGCASYTNGAVAAVVAVDVETGTVEILDYAVVHDCGTLINPVIVEGQIHGGAAQGIGGAVLERIAYGDGGQPLTTTFMDYLIPTATDVPPMYVEHIESPAPNTPLGIKGSGEAGTIGPAASLASAIDNALAGMGVAPIASTPITAATVWRSIRDASSATRSLDAEGAEGA